MSGTIIIDGHNGFNKLIRPEMMWTVRHCWLAGVRFTFNFNNHWYQLIILQTRDSPVMLRIREVRPPLDGPLWDHYFRLGIETLRSGPRSFHPVLHKWIGIRWIIAENCIAPKAVNDEGGGPRVHRLLFTFYTRTYECIINNVVSSLAAGRLINT